MATVHRLTRPRVRRMTGSYLTRDSRCGWMSGRHSYEDHRATTPRAPASYDAVGTTPRLVGSPSAPTTIGRPQLRAAYHLDRSHELVEVDVQDPVHLSGRGSGRATRPDRMTPRQPALAGS
jgi:hypothetical protein